VRVTVVGKAQNLGFPATINQGLNVARGDYLVLLNNDAVVTDGWLNQFVVLAELDSDVTTKHTKDTKRGKKKRG
jgi:GT2 family glycosyltransferase